MVIIYLFEKYCKFVYNWVSLISRGIIQNDKNRYWVVKCIVHGVIIEIWFLSCYFYLRNKSAKFVEYHSCHSCIYG